MKYIISFLCLLLLTGCSIKYSKNSSNLSQKKSIHELYHAIKNLNETVTKEEALKVAVIAYKYPLQLANEYDLVSPPLWHNTLINMNMKDRGFCYHFAQDLLKELKRHDIQSIDLKWVTHKKNDYWEHNAILVKAKNQSYTKGIILDAWRNSGKLYWSYLKDDTRYNWQYDYQKSQYFGN